MASDGRGATAIDTTATEQRGIRGIDYRIDLQCSDISLNNFNHGGLIQLATAHKELLNNKVLK